MRVLFTVAGGPSHLYPLVPLVWAFRVAGHDVRLAGTPGSAGTMRRTGLSIVVLGSGPKLSRQARDELLETAYGQPPWPADWPAHPESLDAEQLHLLEVLGRYSVAAAEGMACDLVGFARQWDPDLIVHDTLALGAVIAATRLGVPCFRYSHGTQDAFKVECRVTDGEPLPEYTELFARFGLDPPTGTPAYIDTMPSSMFIGAEQPSVEMRWVPYNGSGIAPDGLRAPRRRPRVCVTWGLVVPGALGSSAAGMFGEVIAAVAGAGAEVLALTSADQIASLGKPPARVRYISGAPLNLVLPYCDAIVHHGGEGSAMAAASLGVPQLVITREPLDDQCGGRLAATGAAIHLRHQHLETDPLSRRTIRDAIDKLLTSPRHADAAGRLYGEIEQQPAPATVVSALGAGQPLTEPATCPATTAAARSVAASPVVDGQVWCPPGSNHHPDSGPVHNGL
jgi:UDP:flavonoid glycosyltransferase YjiC (YdhE family)